MKSLLTILKANYAATLARLATPHDDSLRAGQYDQPGARSVYESAQGRMNWTRISSGL